jgi:Response regulator containing CheY-like receiver domain and AraC-type DNA-binding domain
MYSLLIVEDENKTREALKRYVPWTEWDIGTIFEAANGKEALELARDVEPDIVVTDIRMPVMDGVALSSQICAELPDTTIILLSAYSDLPYLKSAMKIGAVDYLLKPVDVAELEHAVKTAIERKKESEARKWERTVLSRNLPLLREQFLLSLLDGKEKEEENIRNQCESLGIGRWDGSHWYTALIRFADEPGGSGRGMPPSVRQELKTVLSRALQQCGRFDSYHILLSREPDWIVLAAADPGLPEPASVKDVLGRFVHSAREYFGLHATAYVSRYGVPLTELDRGMKQLEKIDGPGTTAPPTTERNAQLVEEIRKYIEQHYANESLTVNDIADQLAYTSAHLCMVFKKVTGMTINHYLNLFRMRIAKQYLAETDMKIAEVALRVGYSNENYFSKVFRKFENMSPSEYKWRGHRR